MINLDQAELACKYLNDGGVIALPTDTVYGIAGRIDSKVALDRLYTIKGRDKSKPLAVCVADIDTIPDVADVKNLKPGLIDALLPGPVTLLLKRSASLNPYLNPGVDSVGVRVPDHNFIVAVCRIAGPLALTSANLSGKPSTCSIDEFEYLIPDLDCTFDCGAIRKVRVGSGESPDCELGSTVIDLTHGQLYKVIRKGQGYLRATSILDRFGYRCKRSEKG